MLPALSMAMLPRAPAPADDMLPYDDAIARHAPLMSCRASAPTAAAVLSPLTSPYDGCSPCDAHTPSALFA